MWRIGAHYDILQRDPETGRQTVVATTRPCAMCGETLETGIVLPLGNEQHAHAECVRTQSWNEREARVG